MGGGGLGGADQQRVHTRTFYITPFDALREFELKISGYSYALTIEAGKKSGQKHEKSEVVPSTRFELVKR